LETADISLLTSPRKWGSLFRQSGIPATVYHSIVLHRYGPSIYSWEPETIDWEIEKDFGFNPSKEVADKLHGLIAAMTTDQVYNDPTVFTHITHALNDQDPGFDLFSPVTPEAAAWAVYEILLNTSDSHTEFNDEVKAYIRHILLDTGLWKAPKELAWCDMASNVDVTKFDITSEAKTVQEEKLARIAAYVRHRKNKMLEYSAMLFPKAKFKAE